MLVENSSSDTASRRERLPAYMPMLDGWRGLAILGVLACHSAAGGDASHWPRLARALGPLGPVGVEVFFGLSGFLITGRLLREWRRNGRIRLREFYRRRVLRIVPAALGYLLFLRLAGAAGWIHLQTPQWWGALLFYRNYLAAAPAWLTLHFWSLSVEEHFYLLWPLLLVGLRPRRAAWGAAAAAVVVMLWRGGDGMMGWSAAWLPHADFWFRTDHRLDFLFCGCAVAAWMEYAPDGAILAAARAKPAWIAAACGAWWVGFLGGHLLHGFWFSPLTLVRAAAVPTLIGLNLLHPTGRMARLLGVGWLRWLGRLSYSLYLWQELFLGRGFAYLPLRLALAVAVAYLSYTYLERPIIAWGQRRRAPAPAATPVLAGAAGWRRLL